MSEPKWIPWAVARPTAPGLYWWRLPAKEYDGIPLRPEWVCRVALCGMGYADDQLWPGFSNWDGCRRTIPDGMEWSAHPADSKDALAVPYDDDLLTCPFCGDSPRLEAEQRHQGCRLYSSPFRPNIFRVKCPGCWAGSPWHESLRQALSLWNGRARE